MHLPYRVGLGAVWVNVHFFTFGFRFRLFLGKTWVLVRCVVAGFMFFLTSTITLATSEYTNVLKCTPSPSRVCRTQLIEGLRERTE